MSACLIHLFLQPISSFILCFFNLVYTVLHFFFEIDLTYLLQHTISLTNDLDAISSLAEKWLMELNINKCSALSITLKCNSIFHDYNILGATLKRVTNHDYLGVTISSDLNWLRRVKKFIRQAEPLVYLKEPYN